MLTREERAKAEELFGRNPDAMTEDIERALGRNPDGMIDAVELSILRDRAKEEAKAAKAADPKPAEDGPKARTEEAAKAEAEKAEEPKPEESAKKPEGGAERFARVRITVDLTMRDDGDLCVRIQSRPAELSDRTDRALNVRAAVLKLVARRAVDEIADTMDCTWLGDAMLEAMRELEAGLKAAKRKDD